MIDKLEDELLKTIEDAVVEKMAATVKLSVSEMRWKINTDPEIMDFFVDLRSTVISGMARIMLKDVEDDKLKKFTPDGLH